MWEVSSSDAQPLTSALEDEVFFLGPATILVLLPDKTNRATDENQKCSTFQFQDE